MSGSTSAPIFQIEDLLHSYGEVLAAKRALETPSRKAAAFDARSLMAGFLAVFVFAPGCAAATAFLMKADDRAPVIDPPSASKSNRMPLAQWQARPPVDPDHIAAPVVVDVSFLGPVAIRGRLDGEIVATAVAEPAAPELKVITPRPRRKIEIRRAAPVSVVAEAVVPEPEPPSLLEKLFALRNL